MSDHRILHQSSVLVSWSVVFFLGRVLRVNGSWSSSSCQLLSRVLLLHLRLFGSSACQSGSILKPSASVSLLLRFIEFVSWSCCFFISSGLIGSVFVQSLWHEFFFLSVNRSVVFFVSSEFFLVSNGCLVSSFSSCLLSSEQMDAWFRVSDPFFAWAWGRFLRSSCSVQSSLLSRVLLVVSLSSDFIGSKPIGSLSPSCRPSSIFDGSRIDSAPSDGSHRCPNSWAGRIRIRRRSAVENIPSNYFQ